MPSFACRKCSHACEESNVEAHAQRCDTGYFSCVDCKAPLDLFSIPKHTVCLTEAQQQEQQQMGLQRGGFRGGRGGGNPHMGGGRGGFGGGGQQDHQQQ